MTQDAATRKFRYLLQPPIIPIVDEFKLLRRTRKYGRVFAIVAHPLLKPANEACQWAESHLGGSWLVPTIDIAGDKWTLNPKRGDSGWMWLLIKA